MKNKMDFYILVFKIMSSYLYFCLGLLSVRFLFSLFLFCILFDRLSKKGFSYFVIIIWV